MSLRRKIKKFFTEDSYTKPLVAIIVLLIILAIAIYLPTFITQYSAIDIDDYDYDYVEEVGDTIIIDGKVYIIKDLQWTNSEQFDYGTEYLNTHNSGEGSEASISLDKFSTGEENIPFTIPANYTYDNTKIEVNNDVAKLKIIPESSYNFPFTVSGNYTYNNTKIEISGGVGISPYAWWHLNESSGINAFDSSGNSRDGTTVNMEDEDWVAGKLYNCLKFDGADESVNLGNIANFEKTDAFSLEAWFSTTQSTQGAIISREIPTGSVLEGYDLYINVGKITFLLISDVTSSDYIGKTTISTYKDGNWHHLVATYDGSNNVNGITIYIDGSSVATTDYGTTITGSTLNTADCSIGSTDNVNRFFNGKIDEVVIYDDEMDAYTVSNRWNAGAGTEAKIDEIAGVARLKETYIIPYAWWHLNEASGNNVSDSSGNGRNGTRINMEDIDWITGKLNNALEFDGVNEYVNLGDIANFKRTDSFSIEAWFKTYANAQDIISRMRPSIPYRGWTINISPTGIMRFFLVNSITGNNYIEVHITGITYNDDVWHHIIITYDGSSSASGIHIYVDGIDKPLSIITDTLTASSQNSEFCSIGSRIGAGKFWEGYLDEIIIYTKVLSASDVLFRYNSGSGTESMPFLGNYITDDPDIYPNVGWVFTSTIDIFTETATKPSGAEIKYQVSSNNGTTWRWWDGISWAIITDGQTDSWYYTDESNLATDININIQNLAESGTFKFRAFLHSDTGSTRPLLDNILIAEDITYPIGSYEISMNNDIQPFPRVISWLNITETVTKPTNTDIKYQYSTNVGIAWNGNWLNIAQLKTVIQDISCASNGNDTIRFKFQLSTTVSSITPELDNLNITYDKGYHSSGYYISGAFTQSSYRYVVWKLISVNVTIATGTTYKTYVRLSSNILSSDYAWKEVNDEDILSITSALDSVYFQWKVEMTTTGKYTPLLNSFEIIYWEYILNL